ncbi:hypothetical protein NA57DRAFT_77128 [Rhizodiscina lignyota]|uniref:K Homology domain-containing protein n=1 Tax=Rhizodiscina lignyota TaxID=1504668 RepID=A0A9P4M5P8_9PEZI|nr:hypothetical protein NA57DRAFT_77128 [Rhizodiscina lignyota]
MATETSTNGGNSIIDPLAPEQTYTVDASKKDTSHKPTIEDVIDEEDLEHPPPSMHLEPGKTNNDSASGAETVLSEKAAGKQKAVDEPAAEAPKPAPKLDVTSEEAFPALGAPKGKAAASVSSAWGKKPTAAGANGINGGVNGKTPTSGISSRSSTPASGMRTPASMVPPQMGAGRGPQGISLPGRHSDYIQFAPSELIPPNQLKSSRQEVIRDINRKSKAKIEMKPGLTGNTIMFSGTGPQESVREALREVASKLGSKQTVKVPIPASVRPHIIGRGGATIQGINKRTGARIQVPKQDEGPDTMEDDSATIDVIVEGDAIACGLARRDIESIVNEKTSTVNLRLKEIPPEYYPFIVGPSNAGINALEDGRDVRVQVPNYYQWADQAPTPPPGQGQPATFTPQARHPISISGDRQHAQEVQAELERQVEQLRRQLTMDQMDVERGRHQFIVGNRGPSLQDFLEETGCSVILPPPGDDSEVLTIVGPADKIEAGMNKVMDLATSMSMASVDIARQHAQTAPDPQMHARNLTRYLQQRQALEQLERMHNTSIVCPECRSGGPTAWEVFAQDGKNTMRARNDIMQLINAHPPSRTRNLNVDPFFHEHLQQQYAQQLRREFGVHALFPQPEEVDDFPHIVLVYEAPGTPSDYELPRRQGQPSAAEVKEFEKALAQAEQQIMELIQSQQDVALRQVDANPKFHDKVKRYVDREQATLSPDQFPVQLLFNPSPPSGPQQQRRPSGVQVRGPSPAVDDLTAKILAFLEQEEKDELERGYTMSFEFPSKFANFLIGKRGENIKKLRDEFDVDIQVADGKVDLKGPQAKCEACKKDILKNLQKWQDETTHVLKIKPQYHRDLIGARGSQVNRLQDRYSVRINFPRSVQINDDATDAGTEVGSVRNAGRPMQGPDEVVIKGPKKGADEAREELLNLLQYTIDNSNIATVSVSPEQIPKLIGQGGREMDNLRVTTGCQIDVPSARDPTGPDGRAEIRLKGSKKQVEEAKKLLQERVKVFDETVTKTIEVDKKHHKSLIGSGGSNIRDIVIRAGGPSDSRSLARTVRFPPPNSDESTIRVEGSAAVVDKIVAELTSYAEQRATQVTDSIAVPPEKHRLLIGRGGETRRALESQFNVSLDIPKQGTQGEAAGQVKVTGQPSDVEKAKAHIESLVKGQEGVTVNVPKPLHHHIADGGQFFRRLRNDHRVTVDHAGAQLPPRPTGGAEARGRVNGGALPLITDDPGKAADAHSWEVVETHSGLPDDSTETIPWVLRGPTEGVEKAQKQLEKAIEEAKKPSVTGYLILPDPRSYRFVVGPGGSGVNGVRRKTSTQVKVPRGGPGAGNGGGEAIEVVGGKDDVEKAKEMILELVKEGEANNGGRRG